jgi:hypothetical protein
LAQIIPANQVMASNSVSTGERLLALIDDIELISKYVIMSHVFRESRHCSDFSYFDIYVFMATKMNLRIFRFSFFWDF